MTEKRKLPEQIASHTYIQQTARGGMAYPDNRQPTYKETSREERLEVQRSLQRVVTMPKADPSTAWNTFAERQELRRRARNRPVYQEIVPVAARTYAQTGTRASSGRLKAIRRLPAYSGSPVPTRSGQRQGKRGFLWKLLSLFVGIIALIFVANLVLTGSAFRIEHINIIGSHNVVLTHAIQHMGMQGQNIFLINVMALEGRIDASSFVAASTISKQWPNQVTVNVIERQPVLLWKTVQGTYSVDNQGTVIALASETPGAEHLQTVIDTVNQVGGSRSSGKTAKSGAGILHPGVQLNQADITFALTVFERLPKLTSINNFMLRYSGTIYTNINKESGQSGGRGSYIVEGPTGWLAYLGSSNDANPLDNRLVELQQILSLAQKQQSNLASIDLRYGLNPVYTLK